MKRLHLSRLVIAIILSIALHLGLILGTDQRNDHSKVESAPLKALQVRYLGIEKGQKILTLVSKGKPKDKITLDDLALSQDSYTPDKVKDSVSRRDSALKKGQTNQSKPLMQKIGDTNFANSDVTVDVDLPEGVELDQLNEEELKFFSFHKRTLMQYVSTFYQNVQDFELRNPHLQFPLTTKAQVLRGRISFDREGNIKRIKVLQWSDEEKLQEFFLSVLKNIEKVPNPPKLIIHDNDEFSITYGLIING